MAIGALVATILAMAAIVRISVDWQRSIGNSGLGEWSIEGMLGLVVLVGLPLALEIGACVGRGTTGTVLRWISAVVLGFLVLLFAFDGGIFFLPAFWLMVASAIVSTVSPNSSRD